MNNDLKLPHGMLYPDALPTSVNWPMWIAVLVLLVAVMGYAVIAMIRYHSVFKQKNATTAAIKRLFNTNEKIQPSDIIYQANVLLKQTATHYYGNRVIWLYGEPWRAFLLSTLPTARRSELADFYIDANLALYNPCHRVDLRQVEREITTWLNLGLPRFNALTLQLKYDTVIRG